MVNSIIHALRKGSMILSVTALLFMVLMVVVEIFARTFFSFSFLVVDEMAGYLMVAIVFLGLIFSFDSESFVRVEAVYSRVSGKVKRVTDSLFLIMIFLYMITLAYHIIGLNINSFVMESKSISTLETLLYIPQLAMSIGLIGFIVYLALVIFQKLRVERR